MTDSARELIFRLDAARAIANFVAPEEPLEATPQNPYAEHDWPKDCLECGRPSKPGFGHHCSARCQSITETLLHPSTTEPTP